MKREKKHRLYVKVLRKGRIPPLQPNKAAWPRVGQWAKGVKRPRVCVRGWHLLYISSIESWSWFDPSQIWRYYKEYEYYLAIGEGEYQIEYGKVAFERAKLVKRVKIPKKTPLSPSAFMRQARKDFIAANKERYY